MLRFAVGADRQFHLELSKHVSRGAGGLQQTLALSGNGCVDNPELQPETVPKGQLHGVAAELLPERVDAFVCDRNRVLPVQVSAVVVVD